MTKSTRSEIPSQKVDLISNLIYSIKKRTVLMVVGVEFCEFVEINRFPRVEKSALQALFFWGE